MAGVSSASAAEAPVGGGISSLLASPRAISHTVTEFRVPDGRLAIRMSTSVECAYRAGMADILATIWDIADSPKTFPRIDSVRMRSETGTTAIFEQRTVIRALGLAYVSNLVFRDQLTRKGVGSATVSFDTIEVDDTTLSINGLWTVEDRSDSSGQATYVRYDIESVVWPKFPAQALIMRRFGGADTQRLLQDLGAAAARRKGRS